MTRKIIAAVLTIVAVFSVSACGKEVDKKAVNAELVYGTNNLYRFCDAIGTLIYFEDITGSDDQYEAMWFNACEKGKPKENFDSLNSNNGGANGE